MDPESFVILALSFTNSRDYYQVILFAQETIAAQYIFKLCYPLYRKHQTQWRFESEAITCRLRLVLPVFHDEGFSFIPPKISSLAHCPLSPHFIIIEQCNITI